MIMATIDPSCVKIVLGNLTKGKGQWYNIIYIEYLDINKYQLS